MTSRPATATLEIPPQVARLLAEFCDQKKTGTVQLDIVQGRIESWKLTQTGRVDRRTQ